MIFIATGPLNKTASTGGVNITCQLRNASYNVDFTFKPGIPSTTISSLAIEPVLNYDITSSILTLPLNRARYVSMLLALNVLLEGEFGYTSRTVVVVPHSNNSALSTITRKPVVNVGVGLNGSALSVLSTGLVACPEIIGAAWEIPALNRTFPPWLCRNGSLATAIEDLSINFTLSLLSSGSFSTSRLINVSSSFQINYYVYHPKDLAISYLVGLAITLACFLIGIWACQSNGYSASTSFLAIMYTTRNPQLDELAKTDGNEAEGWESVFKTVKLQYGNIYQGGEIGLTAFGKADTIARVAKL